MSTATRKSVDFEITAEGSLGALRKSDDDFVIWGPASVEVVDKEDDRIKAEALEEALPQLMKRASLSYEHADQIVGEILDKFETSEPVEVEIGDTTIERSEFPTDVLKDELDDPALFVAGNIYGDTKKANDVREAVEKDEIRSYSISGQAIVSSMSVEDGRPVTDIEKIDLSAVTLCREGMNQKAKFGVVQKAAAPADDDAEKDDDPCWEGYEQVGMKEQNGEQVPDCVPKDDAEKAQPEHLRDYFDTMNQNNGPLTKTDMESLLDDVLPDGELATKQHVKKEVTRQMNKENATNTGSPASGTSDRPSGGDEMPLETDPEDDGGDSPDETASDPDKVEEKGITMKDLEDALPQDQFKAIKPTLEEKMDMPSQGDSNEDDSGGSVEVMEEEEEEKADDMPPGASEDDDEDSSSDMPPEMQSPEDEPMVEEKAKSLGMDPSDLSGEQRSMLAKADLSGISQAGGAAAPAGQTGSPLEAGADDEDAAEELIKSAEGSTMAGGRFFDNDGGVKL